MCSDVLFWVENVHGRYYFLEVERSVMYIFKGLKNYACFLVDFLKSPSS